MTDPIVGIDLGTSNSVVAHADATGAVKVFADDAGGKVHPSVVSFHPNGGVVVGAAAKQRKVIDPQNTIYSVKRLIGRSFRSPEVQTAKTRSPFVIKEGPNAAPVIATRAGEFAVPEISAIVLDHVRNIATQRLGTQVNRAVVTVPASFNDAQRSATATAGAIAGLTVVRVLNEPTAAALAYGHTRQLREIIAVYDFGGGTFDITLLRLDDQVYEVLGTSGDTFLGGDDLDERLVDKMVAKFLLENRLDLRTNEVAMMRLRAVAEQTKIELSRRSRAVVRIDEIAYGPRGAPLNLQIEISRDEFVREVADIIDRTFPVCTEALALANLSIDRIADVILVGGTTKIPYVRDQVAKFFGKPARADVNPEDAVAAGAALQAMSLERILARRTSSKLSAQSPRVEDETTAQADVLQLADQDSGAMMAPSELTLVAPDRVKRPTASYAENPRSATSEPTKPDTSYSVTRAGVRDEVAEPERYPGAPSTPPPMGQAGFETRTPPPGSTQPLGRITRPVPAQGPITPPPFQVPTQPGVPPPVPTQNRTLFGVPSGPAAPTEIDVDLASAGVPVPLAGEPSSRPATAAGAAIPPPVPRTTGRPVFGRQGPPAPSLQSTTQMPALQRPPERRAAAAAPPVIPPPIPVAPPPAPRLQSQEPISGWLETPNTDDTQAPTSSWFDASGPAVPPQSQGGSYEIPDDHDLGGGYDIPAGYEDLPKPDWGSDSNVGTSPAGWALNSAKSPATTQPLAPTTPIAPPTAPTMVAAVPLPPVVPTRGPGAQTLLVEPSPQTTAKGFQAPQSFPVQLPRAAPAAAPIPQRPAPVLLEVTPRGLGIATVAGFCEELIKRNARVPTETKRVFTTSRDAQDLVRIVVCQGESRRLDNNTVIGDLVLQNLPPRPRGETSIEVVFALDASGVLHVRARDVQTGSEQHATLALTGDLAQDDVATSRDRLQQLRR